MRDDHFGSRLAGAGWAVWFYFFKAVFPLNLMAIYPRWRIDAANPLAYVPVLVVVGGFLLAWRRGGRWGAALLFGLGYFVVTLLPVLGFVNISFMKYSLVADRWQYFSIIGPLALAAAALITVTRDKKSGRVLRAVVGGMSLLILGTLTWRHSVRYGDAETLWRTTIASNPNAALAYNNLGYTLLQQGRLDEAASCLQKALILQPDISKAWNNFARALFQLGRVDETLALLQKRLRDRPDDPDVHNNLGYVLLQQGHTDEAIGHFRKALASRPDDAPAQLILGNALLRKGQVDEAIIHYEKALELRPNDPEAHNNLGNALLEKKLVNEAVIHFQKAVELQPALAEAGSNLRYSAWLLATHPEPSIRNGARAVELATQAARFFGRDNPVMLQTLAAAYAEAGRYPEAIATARQALRLAGAQTNSALVNALRTQLGNYEAGFPFRDRNPTAAPAH